MAQAKTTFLAKLTYGFGAVAYGVKNNGFDYFLLIFYSQILGVDAGLVGLALLIALVFDAFSDPIVGYLSDNTRGRLGRRHPWMYAAAIPVAIGYYFLWSPPSDLAGNSLFLYLVGISIFVRTLITFYEVPSSALAAEISRDYNERTSLMAWRSFFGWTAGILIAAYTLVVILAPSEANPDGVFNRAGFRTYGLIASILIFSSIMIASLGTQNLVPSLPKAPEKERKSLGKIVSEIVETLKFKSFFAVFLATILAAIATGLSMSLNLYLNTYFWGLAPEQISVLILSVLVGALLSLILAPLLSRTWGKKKASIICASLILFLSPVLICLRLAGLLPENGDPILFPILVGVAIVEMTLTITVQILMMSMIADLVEQNELRTGRRSEGVFFATITFTRKATQGLGVWAASLVLVFASFPKGATPDQVPQASVDTLASLYVPAILILWILKILVILMYRIDRQQHEANLAEIEAAIAH
jgi:GPH family glycoside/pentoside/hexuronide:cation symporter